MKPRIIYQVFKADFQERTRRFSFIALCAASIFLSFFSVPDVKAPFVSICMEPSIFHQGSNSSWIPIAIALCGGLLFPVIGFSFVIGNIGMDRNSNFLYACQAMNMKKENYVIGKFLSNLFVLTIIWLAAVISAAVMSILKFPEQTLSLYEYISPFLGIYPGIIFASALAVMLESLPIKDKPKNAIGIITLFIMFLVVFSTGDSNNRFLKMIDYSNYRWNMDSINSVVVPQIGRSVQETGILVPGGMFSESHGTKELVFHGLLWDSGYFVHKLVLSVICLMLVVIAAISLEQRERGKRNRLKNRKERINPIKSHYLNHLLLELKMLLKGFPKAILIFITGLWAYSFFAPLEYVQGYVWVITLIFSMPAFSQIGCREHEYNLTEYFTTMKSFWIKQTVYSYLWGVSALLMLSLPVVLKSAWPENYFYLFCYAAFSFFVPAAACFLGEYSKTRRAFETLFLLLCFLLINIPSFLLNGYAAVMMALGTFILLSAVLGKRMKT